MSAQARFVHNGDQIDYTPGSAVVAGQVVIQGELAGVATRAIAANELGALSIRGVFEFLKASGTVFSAGENVYWDDTGNLAVESSDDSSDDFKLLGKAVAAAGNGTTTVRVSLNQ